MAASYWRELASRGRAFMIDEKKFCFGAEKVKFKQASGGDAVICSTARLYLGYQNKQSSAW
jgi:hypothetical protein